MFKKTIAIIILCLLIILFPSVSYGHESLSDPGHKPPLENSGTDPCNAEAALEIIERVAENTGNISFKAAKTVIMWHPPGTTACMSNITHKAPNLTKTEYLPSSSSTCGLRTIISDGKSTWHYEPSLEVVFHMPEIPSLHDDLKDKNEGGKPNRIKDIALIKDNYEVSMVSTENLIGRSAYIIELKPRHFGNPSRKIWVDKEYPFILKTEKYGSDGALSSVSFYNQIEFFPFFDDDIFKLDIPSNITKVELPVLSGLIPLDELNRKADFSIPMPEFIPPGYVIEGGILSSYKPFPAAHIRLTDGLNTISYFVSPGTGGNNKGQDTLSTMADMSGVNVVRRSEKGYDLTLVGESDESLLKKMAESIHPPLIQNKPPRHPLVDYLSSFLYQLFLLER
ncbi:MAG: hypothetical protein GX969_04765 [Firmicutes bacterium]|nr:hypothetical protein [Bacillota bacterium]